jgi:uncharacterized protein YybS (DUF2232 family)
MFIQGMSCSEKPMNRLDVLGCLGGAAFLLIASAWIPLVGPFFSLLTPLPFLYYTVRLGFYPGIKLAALAVLVLGLVANFAGQPHVFLFVMEFSLVGIGLAELFKRNFPIGRSIFWATVLMLAVGASCLFIIGLSRNMGPVEMVLKYLESHLNETIKAYESANMAGENGLELKVYAKTFISTISWIYPSLMIIGAGFALWLNVIVARPLFRLRDLKYPDFVPLEKWRSPDVLVWGLIASGFSLMLASGDLMFVGLNAMIVILVIYFFHGLSIVLFFFNKYRVPSWIRVGVYFLIIIQQLFMVFLAIAGVFDQWVDFRKIHKRSES